MKAMHRSNKGFTIVELLVAMAVMAVLSAAMVAMFSTSKQTLVHGSNRFYIQQVARYTVNRLTPLLQTAVPVNDTSSAILEMDGAPAVLGSISESVGFSTTQDFLADPIPEFNPRAPVFFFYEIAYEETNNGNLILRKMVPTAPPGGPTPLTAFAPPEERVLTHGRKQGEAAKIDENPITLKRVNFIYERQAGIKISIQVEGPVRTAENQIRMTSFDLDTRIQFPYYANR